MSNFVEIRQVGDELLHAGGQAGRRAGRQADRYDEAHGLFMQFCERVKKSCDIFRSDWSLIYVISDHL